MTPQHSTGGPAPLAVVGVGCLFPKAPDARAYWANIKHGVDAIEEVPASHWRPADYYSEDQRRPDHTYGQSGGFLSPIAFDPLEFGMAPHALEATDTSQLLGMYAAARALDDAGYGKAGKPFDRDRASVILGVTGALELVIPLGARLYHPVWRRALRDAGVAEGTADEVVRRISEGFVGWQEASFPGLLGNVVAGRISKHLNLGGTNCVVDAACASSLSAIHLAAMELESGRSDLVVTGGVDTFNDIFMYMCFSKTPALSPSGHARPYSEDADGTVLGEGVGIVVLKRLAEAERDRDRVYALVRSVGSSSDGKGEAIYAPSAAGQSKALRRAYEAAALSPATIELLEGHGTGTKAGDAAELAALHEVYGEGPAWCALGSVKSQIGHTKAAAGAAGLIKAVFALHHKVLPPTIKVSRPAKRLEADSPFYVNTTVRPWLPTPGHPRRAGLSAMGFGGSNFHCVLEEYGATKPEVDWEDGVEILAFSSHSRAGLLEGLRELEAADDWAALAEQARSSRERFDVKASHRLCFVVERHKTDLKALRERLTDALQEGSVPGPALPEHAQYGQDLPGALGFVFPGQGAQYPGMFRDLVCAFPEALDSFSRAAAAFSCTRRPLGLVDLVYPKPGFDAASVRSQEDALRATDAAQPGLGAVCAAALSVLSRFSVRPDACAGHSYGELPALFAAGRIDEAALHHLSLLRGSLMAGDGSDRGTMLAVKAGARRVQSALNMPEAGVVIANYNAPEQVVLSGTREEIEKAEALLKTAGVSSVRLAVGAAFHSELVATASGPLLEALRGVSFLEGQARVYANTTAAAYPTDADATRALLAEQLAKPVRFVEQIEAMYRDGVRTFLEVGPGARLSGLIRQILGERPYKTIALDASSGKANGVVELARALTVLAALGHSVHLTAWNAGVAAALARGRGAGKRFTVAICGANYRQARPPESASPSSDKTGPARVEPFGAEKVEAKPSAPGSAQGSERTIMNQTPFGGSDATNPYIALTQENLVALQRMQEQTANIHRQFLEGQQAALAAFQDLIRQQQRLLTGATFEVAAPPVAVPIATPPPPAAPPAAVPPAPKDASPTPSAPSPVAAAIPPAVEVLLETVAEKTGYPVEMLELGMSLDADLGIDSIKRVEIFAALQERLPGLPPLEQQHLNELQSLEQIAGYLTGGHGAAVAPAPVSPQRPSPALETPQVAPAPEAMAAGEDLQALLLSVVSEKTGYPSDMLELEMSLDADLGIDSIKRVEIFAALQERLPNAPELQQEQLSALQTLREVLEYVTGAAPAAERIPKSEPVQGAARQHGAEAALRRLSVKPRPFTMAIGASAKPSDGEVAWVVGQRGDELSWVGRSRNRFAAVDYISIEDAMQRDVPRALAAVFLYAPELCAAEDGAVNVFRFLQRLGPELRRLGGSLVAVVRMDGCFGFTSGRERFDFVQAAVVGMVKTAAREWPELHCRVLDLGGGGVPDSALDAALAAGPVELGWLQGQWHTPELVEEERTGPQVTPVAPGEALVITGGARGVTAATARALAASWQPHLVLFGRSPAPTPEAEWLQGLTTESEIKRALLARLGGDVSPRRLSSECSAILSNREALENAAQMRASGAAVSYMEVDVRDREAVRRAVERVRTEIGPIRGIIHGAGVLADRGIEEKTEEQFRNVYDTKVQGLAHLLDAVREPLRILAVFSSSTARFGRKGQVDYAAANEVLNKMVRNEAIARPECRCVAFNWGPWAGGMVNSGLAKVFAAEGIGLIPLQSGADFVVDELSQPQSLGVEVVVLAGASSEAVQLRIDPVPAAPVEASVADELLSMSVSVDECPFLASHVINHRAVLPVAVMVEWLAHAAMHDNPGLKLVGLDDLRVFKGLTLSASDTAQLQFVRLEAAPRDGGVRVTIEMRSRGAKDQLHARAAVLLGMDGPVSTAPRIGISRVEPAAYNNGGIYESGHLFHGPEFQSLSKVDGNHELVVARVHAAPPAARWMRHPLRGTWIADPLVLDSSFQMMTLWSWQHYGVASLPSRLGSYRQFTARFPSGGARIVAQVHEHSAHRAIATIELLHPEEELVVARIEDYECIMDASLNEAFQRNTLEREPASQQTNG